MRQSNMRKGKNNKINANRNTTRTVNDMSAKNIPGTAKKNIRGRVIFVFVLAVFIGIISLLNNSYVYSVRNGEEYTDAFLGGQSFRQEIILEHTPHINLHYLAVYSDPSPDMGMNYTLTMGDKVESGFVPLSSLLNNEWGYIKISTHNLSYVGEAELFLESVGITAEDNLALPITTNTLQKYPDCKLWKDGQLIENGRLNIDYEIYDFAPALWTTLWSVLILALIFVILPVEKWARCYPAAFLTLILFSIGLIQQWPFAGYAGNLHITAQYTFSWQGLGFVRRSFVGTILELFHLHMTPKAWIPYGITCIAVMLILELVILYDKQNKLQRKSMEKCYFLFLCMPFGVFIYFGENVFARLDELLIIAFLLSCITIIKEKGTFLIPILSLMAILTHEMYLTLLIPLVFCLLLYKWYLTHKSRYLVNLIVTSVSSVAVALYVGFIAKPAVPQAEAWEHMQTYHDPAMTWDWLVGFDQYTRSALMINNTQGDILIGNGVPVLILTIIFCLPLIALAVGWTLKFCKKHNDILGKGISLLLFCTAVGPIIAFFANSDYERVLTVFGVGVFFTFLTLWSLEPDKVGISIAEVWHAAYARLGYTLYPGIMIFYMVLTMLGPGTETIFSLVRKLL